MSVGKIITKEDSFRKNTTPISHGIFPKQTVSAGFTSDSLGGSSKSLSKEVRDSDQGSWGERKSGFLVYVDLMAWRIQTHRNTVL